MSEIFRFRVREGVIALALLTGVASLVLSVVAIARDSKTTTTAMSGPVSGVYADGPSSVPHYFVTFLNRGNGDVRGAMNFLFQDGQTSVVFTFNGWIASLDSHSTSGTLTLSAAGVKNSSVATQTSLATPSTISVVFGARQLDFGECSTYLTVSSLSACTFTLKSSGTI